MFRQLKAIMQMHTFSSTLMLNLSWDSYFLPMKPKNKHYYGISTVHQSTTQDALISQPLRHSVYYPMTSIHVYTHT